MPNDRSAEQQRRASEHRQAVETVIAEMRREPGRDLPLPEMAGAVRMSPFYFLRVFRAHTGITPRDFMTAVRIEEAKRLLLTTSLSVTEVCLEVGYSSLGTFSARFSRMVGVAPGAFRRMGPRVVERCILPLRERFRDGSAVRGPDGRDVQEGPGGDTLRGPAIVGTVTVPGDAPAGIVFVGLFPVAAPHGEPVACAVLPAGAGPFFIAPVPEGRFHVLACLLPWSNDVVDYLAPSSGVWVGASRGPVSVTAGAGQREAGLVLRPLRSTDPPILASSPFLLARLAGLPTGDSNPEEASYRRLRIPLV